MNFTYVAPLVPFNRVKRIRLKNEVFMSDLEMEENWDEIERKSLLMAGVTVR